MAKDFPEVQGSQVLAFFAQMMRKFSKVLMNPCATLFSPVQLLQTIQESDVAKSLPSDSVGAFRLTIVFRSFADDLSPMINPVLIPNSAKSSSPLTGRSSKSKMRWARK